MDTDTHFRTAKDDPKQWLGVKLDGDFMVTKVVVKVSEFCCAKKLVDLEVRVGTEKVL